MTTEMIILHNQVKYIPEIQGWVIPDEKCNSPHEHKKKERYMIIPIYSEKSSGKIQHPFIMNFLKIPLSKLKENFFNLI